MKLSNRAKEWARGRKSRWTSPGWTSVTLAGRGQRGEVVAVGLHHALGVAGGARRVDDRGDVGGRARGQALGQAGSSSLRSAGPRPAASPTSGRGLRCRAGSSGSAEPWISTSDSSPGMSFAASSTFGSCVVVLDEERLRPGVLHDVRDRLGGVARVDRDGHAPPPRGWRSRPAPTPPASATAGRRRRPSAGPGPGARAPARGPPLPGPGADTSVQAVPRLDELGRPVPAPLDPLPEHPRERRFSHGAASSRFSECHR